MFDIDWCDKYYFSVFVLSSISRNLHNFSTRFFSMYRGILELKNDILWNFYGIFYDILSKNGSFTNKTCFGVIALFVRTKIYFYRCNFTDKQINKNF